ncbi:MAG TPA: hypothetical protein VMA72_25230 [Streptosporangiaceae bacterium]|nr:hypothetical protein [Streptosporangiaceae bacterium]
MTLGDDHDPPPIARLAMIVPCGLDGELLRTPFQKASIRLPVTVASGSVNW